MERCLPGGRVVVAGLIIIQSGIANGCIIVSALIEHERETPDCRIVAARCVIIERIKANRDVAKAACKAKERVLTLGGVIVLIASVRWRANGANRLQKAEACDE